uniref:Immunoglobulin V-set domain-containing protein n=1 Tax=Equus asinus TaxID=9793 RepID=A0A8C4PS63_EQUAS
MSKEETSNECSLAWEIHLCLYVWVMVLAPHSLSPSPVEGSHHSTCCSSTGEVTNGHYPCWWQKKSVQAFSTLIYNTNSRHSWTPSQFSGSLFEGKAALTLSGAQLEDKAECYCWLVYSGIKNHQVL